MIEQKICDAIEIIVDRAIKRAKFDRTIRGTVLEKVFQNQYLIYYQDSTFYAFSEMEYKNGDTVYVLIPENNMELKKIILGKV